MMQALRHAGVCVCALCACLSVQAQTHPNHIPLTGGGILLPPPPAAAPPKNPPRPEARPANDAGTLAGKPAEHYLDFAQHSGSIRSDKIEVGAPGAAPRVVIDGRSGSMALEWIDAPNLPFSKFVHVPPQAVRAADWPSGCGTYRLARIELNAPGDGVIVVRGHAHPEGLARAGSALCSEGEPPRRLPQCAPDAVSAAPTGVPQRCLPALLWAEPPGSEPLESKGAFVRLGLKRADAADYLSMNALWLEPGTYRPGPRLDVSATLVVSKGTLTLELEGVLLGSPGFGEHGLTATYYPCNSATGCQTESSPAK